MHPFHNALHPCRFTQESVLSLLVLERSKSLESEALECRPSCLAYRRWSLQVLKSEGGGWPSSLPRTATKSWGLSSQVLVRRIAQLLLWSLVSMKSCSFPYLGLDWKKLI